MSALSNLNKKVIDWGVDTTDWEYKKSSELEEGKEYSIKGVFFTQGKFGESGVVISDGFLINAPQGEVETLKQIREDDNLIKAVKNGEAKLVVRSFDSKFGNKGYAFDYI